MFECRPFSIFQLMEYHFEVNLIGLVNNLWFGKLATLQFTSNFVWIEFCFKFWCFCLYIYRHLSLGIYKLSANLKTVCKKVIFLDLVTKNVMISYARSSNFFFVLRYEFDCVNKLNLVFEHNSKSSYILHCSEFRVSNSFWLLVP